MCAAVTCSQVIMERPSNISVYCSVMTTLSPSFCKGKEGDCDGVVEGRVVVCGKEGTRLGISVAEDDGTPVGMMEGSNDGRMETVGLGVKVVGALDEVGDPDGATEGCVEGEAVLLGRVGKLVVGTVVAILDGSSEGNSVACTKESLDGESVGVSVSIVGFPEIVGASVAPGGAVMAVGSNVGSASTGSGNSG
jgi:hypothetical protein